LAQSTGCLPNLPVAPVEASETVEIGLASKVQIGLPCANLTKTARRGGGVSDL